MIRRWPRRERPDVIGSGRPERQRAQPLPLRGAGLCRYAAPPRGREKPHSPAPANAPEPPSYWAPPASGTGTVASCGRSVGTYRSTLTVAPEAVFFAGTRSLWIALETAWIVLTP